MNKEKLWTSNFVIVTVVNLLVFMTHFLLIVTIASYAVNKFHVSTDIAGLAAGIFIIGALIGRLATGYIIEDIGSVRVLIISTLFFVVTSALYFVAINLSLLISIRLLHGIVFGVASTATGTIVSQIIPNNRRGEGIGYYSMGAILAVALGPFVGMYLIHGVDFNSVFIVTSILAATSFALSFFVGKPTYSSSQQIQTESVKNIQISNFLEFKAIPISLVMLAIGFSYSGVLTFMSLYAKQIHLQEASKYYFLVYAIVVLISRPFSGLLYDLKGANFVVYPCLFIYASGMLLFSLATNGISLLLAGAIFALGYGNFLSCAQAISIMDVPADRLGLATATYFVFVDLGFGIGPFLLGSLVPFTGYRGLYLMMTILILATIPLYYYLHGRKASYR